MTKLQSLVSRVVRGRCMPVAALGVLVSLLSAVTGAQPMSPQPMPAAPMGVPLQTLPGQTASVVNPAGVIQWGVGPRGPMQFQLVGDGDEVVLPITTNSPGYSRRSGLQLSVDFGWPGHFGYWPVEVTVRTSAPATTDQTITFQFNAGDYWNSGKSITAQQSFVLPQGATTASMRLLAPQYQEWQTCGWRVLVDGQVDDLLTMQMDFSQVGVNRSNMSNMSVAVAGLSFAENTECEIALQAAYSGNSVHLEPLDFDELPTRWIEYTTLDAVILTAEGVAELFDEHQPQAQALLRWLRSGGNLFLIDAGKTWNRLTAIEKALQADGAVGGAQAGAPGDSEGSEAELLARGWRFAPLTERAGEPVDGALVLAGFELSEESSARRSRNDSRNNFLVRGHGLGLVTAFPGKLMGGGDVVNNRSFIALGQSLVAPRLEWAQRHGNQPADLNQEFNTLLIPNVGVAPVGQFQFLITLFVLGIGPLNYWIFRRRNKLPMLLATVPAAAAITTALLFAYGMFADGFGVRTRARTLTLLDQRSGEAVSWGRLSYYAGISPSDGLAVPVDQAMYPINPAWALRYRYGNRGTGTPREVVWQDQQRLTKGWLPSRTPTQYLAIAARESSKKLELRTTAEGLRIVNRLGSDITHLAVVDHQGRMYWCEELANDAGRVVPVASQSDIAGRIRRLFTENLPEAPAGSNVAYSGGYYGIVSSQSIMEGRLEAINSPQISSWGRGKYIAFTKEAIELDLGLGEENPAGEASFHVVEGSW